MEKILSTNPWDAGTATRSSRSECLRLTRIAASDTVRMTYDKDSVSVYSATSLYRPMRVKWVQKILHVFEFGPLSNCQRVINRSTRYNGSGTVPNLKVTQLTHVFQKVLVFMLQKRFSFSKTKTISFSY